MRAFVITGPHRCEVRNVDPPVAQPGQAVVDVARVGLCGTDVEFFTGEMAYLHQGHESYPLRPGHEWCGTVSAVGDGVDRSWVGRPVTGDTMLGCGDCDRCRDGRQHLCVQRYEVGVRGGFPGALAEQLAVPASSLHALPDAVDDVAGAMVEPGGNALRAARAAGLEPGDRALVIGPGTIGLLAAEFLRAQGVEVHLAGRTDASIDFARRLGFERVARVDELTDDRFDAVIDASNAATVPALAVDLVEPGKRVVYIGIAGAPSLIDTRELVLKDRHDRRHPQWFRRTGRGDRGLRGWSRGPATSRRGHRRAGGGLRRAHRLAARRRRARTQDARGSPTMIRRDPVDDVREPPDNPGPLAQPTPSTSGDMWVMVV